MHENIINKYSCSVTRLDGDWLATTWVKVLRLCFRWLLKLIYWKLWLQ